jgi:prepilin-type N-terminal cleavage/methylation domain-containing protein
MRPNVKQFAFRRVGFTLIETLTVLAITAVLLTAVLQMYHHVRRGVSRLAGHLDENRLAREVLQKIAEDIDRLAAPGFDAKMELRNKYDNGHNAAQLILENNYYGKGTPPTAEVYERIVWQTSWDPFSQALTLYRMHEGVNREDKVLGGGSDAGDQGGLFVPVTDGVTHFEMAAVQGEQWAPTWATETLPTAVRIGLSFSPLEQLPEGRLGVPEEKVFYRTVAVDRTRFIPYQFVARTLDAEPLDADDPNDVDAEAIDAEEEFDDADDDEDDDEDASAETTGRR